MLKDQLINFLKRENITFTSDDGLIIFDYEEKKLVFCYNESDAYYFRFISPLQTVVAAEETPRHFDIINRINLNYKVGKLAIVDGRIWAFVEQFTYSEENIEVLFERCIKVINQMIDELYEEIEKSSEETGNEKSPTEAQPIETE